MIKNLIKDKKPAYKSTYKPTLTTSKKAKKILHDLVIQHEQPKVCQGCERTSFGFDLNTRILICNNKFCDNKSTIMDPLHRCPLTMDDVNTLICMIIDSQPIMEIANKLNVKKSIISRIRDAMIDQIN